MFLMAILHTDECSEGQTTYGYMFSFTVERINKTAHPIILSDSSKTRAIFNLARLKKARRRIWT